jgi:hypothetical protein
MSLEAFGKEACKVYDDLACLNECRVRDPSSTTGLAVLHRRFSCSGLLLSVTVRFAPHQPPPIATSNWIVS